MAIRRTNKTIVQKDGGNIIFGEGTDGAAIFDGTTTVISLAPTSNVYKLVKDIYCTNLTVNSGVTLFTNGFRVFVNGTFTNNGTVGMPAAVTHSVTDGSGTIAGRQTSLNPSKAWGTSTDPISVTDLYDLDDAMSGFFITGAGVVTKIAGGSLGTAGSNGTTTLPTGPFAGSVGNFPGALTGQAGGRGNAGAAGNPATAGTGGAGGLGGGLVIIFAKTIAGSGTLVSYGVAGTAGTPSTPGAAGPAGNPAPNISGYHTTGSYHHPAGSTGPNPGAGTAHPGGHNSGTHPTSHHHPAGSTGPNPGAGTPHPSGHHDGYYHHPANSILAISPHHATVYPAGHNPGNPHAAGHNSGTGYHHHPAGNTHGSHAANGPRNFTNHNATVSGKNHNAGHGYHHHGSGTPHGHHPAGGPHNAFSHHNGTYHGAGHNSTYHPSGHHDGNHNHPANAPHSGKPSHNATVYNASHNAGTHPTTHHHPAGSTGPNPGAGTPHPSGHNSGTHPHTAATLNVTTGAVTGNRSAAPSHSAPTLNYSGGAGGAVGAAGTANPGATGATGSTGGIVVVTRNAGNVASQIGHSNYSKVIDI